MELKTSTSRMLEAINTDVAKKKVSIWGRVKKKLRY